MLPTRAESRGIEADRLARTPGVDGECHEKIRQLEPLDAALELDRAEVVAMESLGELLEQRVVRIGGDTLDDELAPRDAERQHRALGEEPPQGARHRVGGAFEQRVSGRIDRVLVHRDRQLDEKVPKLASENGGAGRRAGGRGDRKCAQRWRRDGRGRRATFVGAGASTRLIGSDEGHADGTRVRYSSLTTEPLP